MLILDCLFGEVAFTAFRSTRQGMLHPDYIRQSDLWMIRGKAKTNVVQEYSMHLVHLAITWQRLS